MIILDTNVVSELMRSNADERVLRWIGSRNSSLFFTTTLTEAEILMGIAVLPLGRRRSALKNEAEAIFAKFQPDHILTFDRAAADMFATLIAERRKVGLPIQTFDAQIAAIARSRGAAVATRNVKDFVECGVEVINPWDASA